jgi:hypothetical protein
MDCSNTMYDDVEICPKCGGYTISTNNNYQGYRYRKMTIWHLTDSDWQIAQLAWNEKESRFVTLEAAIRGIDKHYGD